MSRSLRISQVCVRELDSNKNIPLMNFIGDEKVLTTSDLPQLDAIRLSLGTTHAAAVEIAEVMELLQEHGRLRFTVEH